MSETLARPIQSVRRLREEETLEIGVEAYHYLYPLVLMHVERRVSINYPLGVKSGFGPQAMFHHMREYPPAGCNGAFRPEFDVLCSRAWLELTQGPYVVSVPDIQGRYYVLPFYDMWTEMFAGLGTRTSGTGSGHFAIVPRGWKGALPYGVARIESPTTHIGIIVRTETHGPSDYAAVHKIQNGYTATLLSLWGRSMPPQAQKIDPEVDFKTAPADQVRAMSPASFFSLAADLMMIDTPHLTDGPILSRMRRIGLEPGTAFNIKKATAAVQAALAAAPEEGHRQMTAKLPTLARIVNGWQMNADTMGTYGNHYLKRAVVAMSGLGALPPEDAIHLHNTSTSEGAPITSEHRFLIHFRNKELPPARAFWSLTLYDREGFAVPNPINRYAIGDRDSLAYNPDGSLDIYIQKDRPPTDKEANWLPSSGGPVSVTMRLYSPRAEALDGRWVPPVVQRNDQRNGEWK